MNNCPLGSTRFGSATTLVAFTSTESRNITVGTDASAIAPSSNPRTVLRLSYQPVTGRLRRIQPHVVYPLDGQLKQAVHLGSHVLDANAEVDFTGREFDPLAAAFEVHPRDGNLRSQQELEALFRRAGGPLFER